MNKFIIKDWANNILFNGKTFKTFEDAWDFIYEKYPNDPGEGDDSVFQDLYVEEVNNEDQNNKRI